MNKVLKAVARHSEARASAPAQADSARCSLLPAAEGHAGRFLPVSHGSSTADWKNMAGYHLEMRSETMHTALWSWIERTSLRSTVTCLGHDANKSVRFALRSLFDRSRPITPRPLLGIAILMRDKRPVLASLPLPKIGHVDRH